MSEPVKHLASDKYALLKADFRTAVVPVEGPSAHVIAYDVYSGVTSNGVISTGLTEADAQYFG